MSTLVAQVLETDLTQVIKFNLSDRDQLAAIYPYLYVHNSPAGTFNISLMLGSSVIISNSFTCADIKTAMNTTDDYIHCFYPITPTDVTPIESGIYEVVMTSTGYTPSDSSFIGWIQEFENIQNIMDYIPVGDEQNSLTIRFKSYTEGIR